MKIIIIPTFILIIQYAFALPRTNRDDDSPKPNYAGISSQILAANLLKDKIDYNGNQVFSPLGISQILAILAEGARGDVYKEFIKALSYPENKKELRNAFKIVLKNFKNDLSELQSPAFKTWFYLYPHNTVRDEYKSILLDYYYAEVKNIKSTNWDHVTPTPVEKQREEILYALIPDKYDEKQKSEIIKRISPEQFDEILQETIKRTYSQEITESNDITSPLPPSIITTPNLNPANSKDIIEFEDLKKSKPFDNTKNKFDEQQKDASKFDNVVEDKQYVEVPIIKEEMIKDDKKQVDKNKFEDIKRKQDDEKQQITPQESIKEINQQPVKPEKLSLIRGQKEKINDDSNNKQNEKIEGIKKDTIKSDKGIQLPEASASSSSSSLSAISKEQNFQDNETIKDDEKLEAYKKDIIAVVVEQTKPIQKQKQQPQQSDSNEPEKISIPLKKLETEFARVLRANDVSNKKSGGRSLLDKEDIASSLSANSLSSRDILNINKHRMMLFNGMYYRGNWAYPFQELKSSDNDVFYLNNNKKIPITMMRAGGTYRIADYERLKAQVIEFPYENRKYSFYVLLPKEKEGLHSLIENFEPRDILEAKSQLSDSLIEVSLPKFKVEQTSHSEETLKKLGLKTVFSSELGGLEDITDGVKLNIEEVVQHVNIRVDEGSASPNIFAATSLESRSSVTEQKALPEIEGALTELVKDSNKTSEYKQISIDRPFLYWILDNENDFVIIVGKILDPSKTEYDSN